MLIPTSSIKVERSDLNTKRFRKDFGAIQEMVKSLKEYGQIQPIVVEAIGELASYKRWLLIAGERRLIASLFLGWTEIEATEKRNLSPLQRKEIELEENIQRKDIEWQEQIEATRQLHELKIKQYGQRLQGGKDPSGWTMKDTAVSMSASLGTVSQDIQLANDLRADPSLRPKVSNLPKAAARSFIKREKQTQKMREKVKQKEIELSSDLSYGKCEEMIKYLPSNSVNLLITDPPWGVADITAVAEGSLSSDYDQGTNLGTKAEMMKVYKILLPELYRVTSPGAHLYIFFAPDWYFTLKDLFTEHGFLIDPVPLIWPKHRTTMVPNPYHYIPSYEMIMFGCKEPQTRTLLKPKANCLLDYPADSPIKRIHPLQKPIKLISMMIENSSLIGETVLDPFAGSAVVLKAAKKLSRRGIGFESDEKNFLMAQEYLAQGE